MERRTWAPMTDAAPLTFTQLAELEPRLGVLLEQAKARHRKLRSRKQTQKIWEAEFAPEVHRLVGEGRYGGGPLLTCRAAHDLAYRVILAAYHGHKPMKE